MCKWAKSFKNDTLTGEEVGQMLTLPELAELFGQHRITVARHFANPPDFDRPNLDRRIFSLTRDHATELYSPTPTPPSSMAFKHPSPYSTPSTLPHQRSPKSPPLS